MSTPAFQERESFYFHAVNSAREVLSHPDLDTTDHPHVDKLLGMVDYAALLIPDKAHGILHTGDLIIKGSVAILPLLESDLNGSSQYTYDSAENLNRNNGNSIEYDLRQERSIQAHCRHQDEVLVPMISLAPKLAIRSSVQVGSTMAHELDHAHKLTNPKENFRYGVDTPTSNAILEISAYRLEDAVLRANYADGYEEERSKIEHRYRNQDLPNKYRARDADPLTRNVRTVAFLNYFFDRIGAQVGTQPSSKVIKGLQAQDII
ncbi:MAG: hypothetical protein WCJ86_02510 [Candidatus Saccharibacteria bacterium]